MADTSYGWSIFFIGFLLGAIVSISIIWILYATHTFIFSNCVSQTRECVNADYYNDPGEAIAHGSSVEDILYIQNGELFYQRVPKSNNCVPGTDQTIHILYPQYCTMSGTNITGTWKETFFNSNIYDPTNVLGPQVVTDGNCIPMAGYVVTTGEPQLKWDPTH